ncbi:hypothetical protein NQZ68_028111 [Dissostichus eleginoides]|nr:hypothetical protein NQZ68_028111 [Dissostichus eleginoides]
MCVLAIDDNCVPPEEGSVPQLLCNSGTFHTLRSPPPLGDFVIRDRPSFTHSANHTCPEPASASNNYHAASFRRRSSGISQCAPQYRFAPHGPDCCCYLSTCRRRELPKKGAKKKYAGDINKRRTE